MLFGTSAVGEPGYGTGDAELEREEPLDAPVVELSLEYDPEPESRVKVWGIPVWILALGVSAWALNRLG